MGKESSSLPPSLPLQRPRAEGGHGGNSEMEQLPFSHFSFQPRLRDRPFRASTALGAREWGEQRRGAPRCLPALCGLVPTASSITALHASQARVHRASPRGGWAWRRGPHARRRRGRDARGAGRGGARAGPGDVGCHPRAHLGRGAGNEPLRRGDLRGPRAEQEVSQGRELEGPVFPFHGVRRAPAAARPARPANGDAPRG